MLERNQNHIQVVDEWVPNTVSSTLVRRELGAGRSVKYLLDDRVIEYIQGVSSCGCNYVSEPRILGVSVAW